MRPAELWTRAGWGHRSAVCSWGFLPTVYRAQAFAGSSRYREWSDSEIGKTNPKSFFLELSFHFCHFFSLPRFPGGPYFFTCTWRDLYFLLNWASVWPWDPYIQKSPSSSSLLLYYRPCNIQVIKLLTCFDL